MTAMTATNSPTDDPNETLAMLRRLAGDCQLSGDHEPWVEHFAALDESLSNGGVPPDAWTTSPGVRRSGDHE